MTPVGVPGTEGGTVVVVLGAVVVVLGAVVVVVVLGAVVVVLGAVVVVVALVVVVLGAAVVVVLDPVAVVLVGVVVGDVVVDVENAPRGVRCAGTGVVGIVTMGAEPTEAGGDATGTVAFGCAVTAGVEPGSWPDGAALAGAGPEAGDDVADGAVLAGVGPEAGDDVADGAVLGGVVTGGAVNDDCGVGFGIGSVPGRIAGS